MKLHSISSACVALTLVVLVFASHVNGSSKTEGGKLFVYKNGTVDNAFSLPVVSMVVTAHMVDYFVKVTLEQHYRNTYDYPLSAEYRFPLDDQASVTSFSARVGDDTVVGVIEEKKKAQQMYDDAVNQGKKAFLLNSEASDLFLLSIGNVPPQTEAVIYITYFTRVKLDEGEAFYRFYLPSTDISDRYYPAVPGGASSSPHVTDVSSPIFVHLDITMPFDIVDITSPSNTFRPIVDESPLSSKNPYYLSKSVSGKTGSVYLWTQEMSLDFVIVVQQSKPNVPRAWVESNPKRNDSRVALVAYSSNGDQSVYDGETPVELVFVVDTSGSMDAYNRIGLIRTALVEFINQLKNPTVYFNIIRFESSYTTLWSTSKQMNVDTRREAITFVNAFSAGGGTEVWRALEYALSARTVASQRSIVVMTDGEIYNTDAVLSAAASKLNGARIFSLGIGGGASHNLVDGLARVGKGVSEYVQDNESPSAYVKRQAARAATVVSAGGVVVWDVEKTSNPAAFLQGKVSTPTELDPVYPDSTSLAFKFLAEDEVACVADRGIIVRASKNLNITIACSDIKYIEGDMLHKLAVRGRIRDIEELPSAQRSDTQNGEIIALSKEFSISSSLTAFIAIMENTNQTLRSAEVEKGAEMPMYYPSGALGVYHTMAGTAFVVLLLSLLL